MVQKRIDSAAAALANSSAAVAAASGARALLVLPLWYDEGPSQRCRLKLLFWLALISFAIAASIAALSTPLSFSYLALSVFLFRVVVMSTTTFAVLFAVIALLAAHRAAKG